VKSSQITALFAANAKVCVYSEGVDHSYHPLGDFVADLYVCQFVYTVLLMSQQIIGDEVHVPKYRFHRALINSSRCSCTIWTAEAARNWPRAGAHDQGFQEGRSRPAER
jgi:hypothetical protein